MSRRSEQDRRDAEGCGGVRAEQGEAGPGSEALLESGVIERIARPALLGR